MKQTVFHVIGFTQYMGTCKMHLFEDCPQLTKRRVAEMAWGARDSTGAIHSDIYENLQPRQTCKICAKRQSIQRGRSEPLSSPPLPDEPNGPGVNGTI